MTEPMIDRCARCEIVKLTGDPYGRCHKHDDGTWSCGDVHSDAEDDDHAALVAYLLSAVRRKDWHAVSDAANDLRVLEERRRP